MDSQLPDVQAGQPEVTVGLNRVGVTGVEKLVEVSRPENIENLVEVVRPEERPYVLMATFDVFVDLPKGRKGADMSRNMEAVDEILGEAVSDASFPIEDICGDAAERLLSKHDYTTRAEVRMEAEFALRERAPESDLPTESTVTIIASATASEDGTREEVGARVTGMTVCPCSQGMMEGRARRQLADLGVGEDEVREFLREVPQAGHAQRGHATLTVESEGSPDVDLFELIDVARDSMSARIYNLAKRPDEDHMTYHAHANAKFVEDCVRDMARGVVDRFPHLPEDAVVTMKQSNEESIHQHNAHAERVTEIVELREEVGN